VSLHLLSDGLVLGDLEVQVCHIAIMS
jgi:hypothetical protein